MRAGTLVVVSMVVGALLSSCDRSEAAAMSTEDTLVLEVGGEQGSLRAALQAAGIVMAPPHLLHSPEPSLAPHEATPDDPGSAGTGERPAEEPPPAPSPLPEPHREVVLARGQTLIHLAKKHLGDGNRFREILELNGWTEQQARRLSEGTKVKIPAAGGVPPERRDR